MPKGKVKSKPDAAETGLGAGRMPPHSSEMERALLCSLLIDPGALPRVIDIVNAAAFYDRRHQLIFAAMERLFQRSAPVDSLTVSDELKGTGDWEAAGGDEYLIQLTGEVATSAHAEHYAQVVREKAALRRLIQTSSRLAAEAYEAPTVGDLIDRAMGELFEIYSSRDWKGWRNLNPVMKQLSDYLDKLHARRDQRLTGVGTGFPRLDELTAGFQNGDLIVVAGRPSMGKTAFSLDLARNACKLHRVPVAYFSLEMAAIQIAMRLLAAEANVSLGDLRVGRLDSRGWRDVSMAIGTLSDMPFYIDDTGTLGLTELRARARILKQHHNVGIIFIDYLQLMKPPKAESREQEVAQISRALKGLARELNIPVVAMSQLSRAVEARGDKRPQLADLRDSGAIEQDADVVMFIYREAAYRSDEGEEAEAGEGRRRRRKEEAASVDNRAEIIIRKQRNGPPGTVELLFHEQYAHFVVPELQTAEGAQAPF